MMTAPGDGAEREYLRALYFAPAAAGCVLDVAAIGARGTIKSPLQAASAATRTLREQPRCCAAACRGQKALHSTHAPRVIRPPVLQSSHASSIPTPSQSGTLSTRVIPTTKAAPRSLPRARPLAAPTPAALSTTQGLPLAANQPARSPASQRLATLGAQSHPHQPRLSSALPQVGVFAPSCGSASPPALETSLVLAGSEWTAATSLPQWEAKPSPQPACQQRVCAESQQQPRSQRELGQIGRGAAAVVEPVSHRAQHYAQTSCTLGTSQPRVRRWAAPNAAAAQLEHAAAERDQVIIDAFIASADGGLFQTSHAGQGGLDQHSA